MKIIIAILTILLMTILCTSISSQTSQPAESTLVSKDEIIKVTRGQKIIAPFDGFLFSNNAAFRGLIKCQEEAQIWQSEKRYMEDASKAKDGFNDKLTKIQEDAYKRLAEKDEQIMKSEGVKKWLYLAIGLAGGFVVGYLVKRIW